MHVVWKRLYLSEDRNLRREDGELQISLFATAYLLYDRSHHLDPIKHKSKIVLCGSTRSQLSRIVWKPPEPTKSHLMLTHWSSRERLDALDAERVGTFLATSRHLREYVLPIFEGRHFRLVFRLLPFRSRSRF